MKVPALILGLLLSSWTAAHAARLKGRLTAASGEADFEGFVLWIAEGPGLPPLKAPRRTHSIVQVNKQFSPRRLAVRAGDKVVFENLDNLFHNVFSLDKDNRFDLGLFKGRRRFSDDGTPLPDDGAPPAQEFRRAGKFHIFCNIHPDMSAAVYAFEHGYFAAADRNGVFDLPAPNSGRVTVMVDGPLLAKLHAERLDAGRPPEALAIGLELLKASAVVPHSRKDGGAYPKDRPGY